MRRTQLYLDEDLWNLLHANARTQGTTVSELVRRAVRERYLGDRERRREAMQAFVGVWKNRFGLTESEEVVRTLRRGKRIDHLGVE